MIDPKQSKNYLYQKKSSKGGGKREIPKISDEEEFPETDMQKVMVFNENIRPLRCYKCGSEEIVPMDLEKEEERKKFLEPRSIDDMCDGNLVKVVLNKIRYKCKSCGKTFSLDDPYPSGLKRTQAFGDYIAQKMIAEEFSVKEMSALCNVSQGYISKVLNEYIERFQNSDYKICPCEALYFHKFLYGKNKKTTCCLICGKDRPDGKVKLLAVYEEYSERAVDLFIKKLGVAYPPCHIYYDYDPDVDMGTKLYGSFEALGPIASPLVNIDRFVEDIRKIGKSNNQKSFYRDIKNLVETEQHHDLYREIMRVFNRLSEEDKSYFNHFISGIKSCQDSFYGVQFFREWEVDISGVKKKVKEFEEKLYPSHIMVIRLMILNEAAKRVLIGNNFGEDKLRTQSFSYYHAFTTLELDSNDVICRYIDVETLLSDEKKSDNDPQKVV